MTPPENEQKDFEVFSPQNGVEYLKYQDYLVLRLMRFIPDVFEDVLIFENDDIEHFDIGWEPFYLIEDQTVTDEMNQWVESGEIEDLADWFRAKYSISTKEPEKTDQVHVRFFDKLMVEKPATFDSYADDGTPVFTPTNDERLCWGVNIRRVLESFKTDPPQTGKYAQEG